MTMDIITFDIMQTIARAYIFTAIYNINIILHVH